MPTIVVEIMPKAEILDPQGKAVAGALTRLGNTRFTGVRIGKRFELAVDGTVDDALLADVAAIADDMLANTVIEEVVSITVVDGAETDEADAGVDDGALGESAVAQP